jgi:hypothetical protein
MDGHSRARGPEQENVQFVIGPRSQGQIVIIIETDTSSREIIAEDH